MLIKIKTKIKIAVCNESQAYISFGLPSRHNEPQDKQIDPKKGNPITMGQFFPTV